MTRLERVIQAFNDYDNLVKELVFNNNDNSKDNELEEIRENVSLLVGELKRYGCRRKN